MSKLILLGCLDGTFEMLNRVYSPEGICPTINTCGGGDREPKIMESQIVAMRGRNPDNPADRRAGIEFEQTLEVQKEGICNTITSVTKDNMILEKETINIKQATKSGWIECLVGGVADLSFPDSKTRRGRVIENGNVSPTLQTEGDLCRIEKAGQESSDNMQGAYFETKYRIRKLTPLECFRLMNFDDKDFYEAESCNSNTQLYKQAGNSIVVSCLVALFSQLGIHNVESWNDMSLEKKQELTKVNICDNPEYEKDFI